MRKYTTKIRQWLKEQGFNHAIVSTVTGGIIVIDNLPYSDAATIATMVTGVEFYYMTPSMAKLKTI